MATDFYKIGRGSADRVKTIDYSKALQPTVDRVNKMAQESKAKTEALINNMPQGVPIEKVPEELRGQVTEFLAKNKQEYIEASKIIASGINPQDERYINAVSTINSVNNKFNNLSDQLENDTEGMAKFGAVAAAVGASIGAVNQMMQAGYQRTIASIDEQIEAEKKRDGKSAASVAKIQQMEKKKEQTQRKAFEMNKKMLMAQTIANTAAGIAGVLAGIKDPLVTAPLAVVMAGVIGAMGAAQLAVIAGTSFQGGGGSASGGIPSAITVGSRSNNIDLARSQGARGELAYLRGESGIGGPENFRSAFGGYRNRAEGGNTGFMVGEQGPELFVPERPGRIVASDDIAPAGNSNVTFNINTIDASGVEDILVSQRGNIIGMIREGANSYGQDFIEEVDTTVFTQNSIGVSRY